MTTTLEMDFVDGAPQKARSWLLWAFIKVDEMRQEKITQLKTELQSALDAINVGQKEEDGWLELYFYAPSAKKFQSLVSEILGSSYASETGSTRDAKWEHYLYTLYPSALMLQQIQSRHIIDELKEAGDDLSVAREVEHYLGFLTESQAKRVAERLYLQGFKEKNISYNSSEEYGNTLVVTQEHAIDEVLLEELAFLLITTAEQDHGIYAGWSTEIAQ